ncbi:MAG TPA: hypothetical protein VMI55_05265 [Thermoplasmata archaeon]|nr:hypothetical protein [Thermoplasmata archaeon]
MLRETTFRIGGALTVALGLLLAAGLVWAGAGLDFFGGYIAAGLAVGFGAFFFWVGGAEGRERRRALVELENDHLRPP